MHRALAILLCLLAACNSSGVPVWNGQSTVVQSGAHRFRVVYSHSRAEAYRINPVLRPKMREVLPDAVAAIRQVTGCAIDRSSLRGDVALVKADLIC
ncbi:MAG: hypothetical protein JXR14_01430 [Paracoccaceae bacterium]